MHFVVFSFGACGGVFVLSLALLPFLLALSVASLLDEILLIAVQVLILVEGVLAQVSHVYLNFRLLSPHVLLYIGKQQLEGLDKVRVVLSDPGLVGLKLVLDVQHKLSEKLLFVEDQFRDDCFVDFDRGELVLRVLDDDSREFCEVLGNAGRALLHNQEVLGAQILQKLLVVENAFKQRLWLEHRRELVLVGGLRVLR